MCPVERPGVLSGRISANTPASAQRRNTGRDVAQPSDHGRGPLTLVDACRQLPRCLLTCPGL